MPVYPGTKPPGFIVACTIDRDGFKETELTMYSHTGTHMDSPAHLFEQGQTLDEFNPGYFYGSAVVLDVSNIQGEISIEVLAKHHSVLERMDFLILYTGWDKLWGQDEYFNNYPVLSLAAARWLVDIGFKAIGVDAISVDSVEQTLELPVHKILLSNNILIIENLTNLHSLIGEEFILCSLPLKTAEADGAPTRAVAIIDK